MMIFSNTRTIVRSFSILTLAGLAAVATAFEDPVDLGSAGNFAILAGSTVTSTAAAGTVITGDIGLSPGTAVTGFPPATITGTWHLGDPIAALAQLDLTIAYDDAAGRSTAPIGVAGNLGGMTLFPGLYKSTGSLEISSGDLTLDAQGDPNGIFIFQMASTLTTTPGRQMILAGGAQASNIYWQVGSSATFGTTSVVYGNVLALVSITINTGAAFSGRALARNGAVTLDSNVVEPIQSSGEIVLESRLAADLNTDIIANITPSPEMTTMGTWVHTPSKSNALWLQAEYSMYSTGIGDSVTFSPAIASSGRYNVYVTVGGTGANTDNNAHAIVTIDHAFGTLVVPNVSLVYTSSAADAWALVASDLKFNAGPAGSPTCQITFENLDGNNASGGRFTIDGIKLGYSEVPVMLSVFMLD